MSGYIELNRTGFAPFDDALSLIEDAGTAYHHTSQWIEDGWNGEKPYLDQINESIAFAAKSYMKRKEQIIELTRQRDLAVEAMRVAAEQIANETAEACAKYIDSTNGNIRGVNTVFSKALRSGAWKDFKK